MNVKTNKTKKQANVENQAVNLLSKEELCKRIEGVEKELKSYTWRELETNGKFAKNDKLSFITDDMLIVGCDIGSETHYIRAIDIRGRNGWNQRCPGESICCKTEQGNRRQQPAQG